LLNRDRLTKADRLLLRGCRLHSAFAPKLIVPARKRGIVGRILCFCLQSPDGGLFLNI
jgi:hypothetical protein